MWQGGGLLFCLTKTKRVHTKQQWRTVKHYTNTASCCAAFGLWSDISKKTWNLLKFWAKYQKGIFVINFCFVCFFVCLSGSFLFILHWHYGFNSLPFLGELFSLMQYISWCYFFLQNIDAWGLQVRNKYNTCRLLSLEWNEIPEKECKLYFSIHWCKQCVFVKQSVSFTNFNCVFLWM